MSLTGLFQTLSKSFSASASGKAGEEISRFHEQKRQRNNAGAFSFTGYR